ncbi:hypothetical protein NpNSSI1_00008433 [Neofusicoccum parvum]|nr:hypothetical protein NpNSSI1_00008433 [Neofusicoccum parvum]
MPQTPTPPSPSPLTTTGHPYTSTTPSTTPPYNAYASLGFGAHNAIRKSYLDDAVAARRRPPPPLEKRGFLAWARRLVAPRRREVEEAVPPVPDRPALLPRFAFEPRRRDDRADDQSEVCREIVEANEALMKLQRAQKELRQVRNSVSKEGSPFFQHQQAEQELEREKRRQHLERRLRWPLKEGEPEQEEPAPRKNGHALARSTSLKRIPGELLESQHSSRQAQNRPRPQVTFTRCSLHHEHYQQPQQPRAPTQGPRPVPAIPPGPFDFDLPPPSPGQTARSPPARRSFELQLPPVDSPPPPGKLGHATTATLLSSFPAPPSTTTDDGAEGNDEPSLDHAGRLDAIREETEDNDGASSSSGPSSLELPEPTMALAAAASRSTLSVGDATVGASSVGSGGTAETAVTEEGEETEVEVEAEAKERRSGAVRLVPYADSDDEGACTVVVGGASFQLVAGAGDAGMEEEESVRKRASQSRIPRPVVQEPRPKLDRATQEERLGLPLNTHAAKVAQAELGLVRQPVVKKKAGGKGQPRKSVFVEMV